MTMMKFSRWMGRSLRPQLAALAILVLPGLRTLAAEASAPAGNSAALEALQRLKGIDLEANPALKAAVLKVVEGTRGTPQFVELVRDFSLGGQEAGLWDVAVKRPTESAGAEAARLLLRTDHATYLTNALRQAPVEQRQAVIVALANVGEAEARPLLRAALEDEALALPARTAAVRGLARTESGARELLQLAAEGKLPESLRTAAAFELAQSRWPEVRTAAAKVLPTPKSADGTELPSIPELLQAKGDATRGAKVFRSEQAGCSKCHRVGDEGVDFGPALSQIGTKLGKQALFESILDPSAGIAFGYEGWEVETKDGQELFGLIASETPAELAIKQSSGVVVRVATAQIVRRDRQRLSAMPAGLGQLLTRQELVDVVEYLTTLRAEGGGGAEKH